MARGPPAGGGAVEFIGGVEKIVGNGAIGVEKSGGALAFALEESVGGAGFSVGTEESLGACHLACGHTGFSLERSVGGVELPVAFGKARADGAFGGFVTFFVEVDAVAVAAIGLAKLPTGERAIGSIEKKFDGMGFRLAGAEDHFPLEITVGSVAQYVGGDERGLIVIPDGIAKGLIGRRRNLVCVIDGLADGVGGLKTLKEGIDDKADL